MGTCLAYHPARSGLLAALVFVAVSSVPRAVLAGPDFDLRATDWNGASRFFADAREATGRVLAPSTIDLDELTENDALVLLAPDSPLPEGDLVEFVRRGGRLVVADDFGSGGPLLERFGIRRMDPEPGDAPRVRGQDELLVARPYYAHPLTEGVGLVVTNRPAVLQHPRLVPLLGLVEGEPGVLVTGVVGEGRVVALGDPSALMNAMTELQGNRRLGQNLLRFVVDGTPPRRLFVATGQTRFEGSFDAANHGTPRQRLEEILRTVGQARLPDDALRVAATLLAALLLLLLGTVRDRRVEPDMPWLEPGARDAGGVRLAMDSIVDGLRGAVTRRLGVIPGSSARDRKRAIAALRLPSEQERRMLRALDALGARGAGKLSIAELGEIAETFEATVARRSGHGNQGR